MKKLNNIIKEVTLLTGIAMSALIMTTTLASAEPDNDKVRDKTVEAEVTALKAEVLAQLEATENVLAEFEHLTPPTVKIFNANQELIYEKVVEDIELINDKKLLSLIHQSDLLMKFENTAYYRMGK